MSDLLIVDDDASLRMWATRVMGDSGYSCEQAGSAEEAWEMLTRAEHALVLLDVNMPGESGIDLLRRIRAQLPATAVVIVTGEDDPALAMRAIELGAYGYMVKPVRTGELLINVANALYRRTQERDTLRAIARLRQEVHARDADLAQALQDLKLSRSSVRVSQAETIFRLARLVEFRDEETGEHLHRMSSYCGLLAQRAGLPDAHCEMLRLSSQLHDVGKVAISDSILHKPGTLTVAERAAIETHAQIGWQMLAGSPSEVVQTGALIAHTHHERWDGAGYPRALAGEAIPLEGRIAAVADVFDALTSSRCYRPAFPPGRAVEIMRAERATHFDPALLDTFLDGREEVEAVRRRHTG